MHINGKYRLACNTLVSKLKSNTITIRPLSHMAIHKDLFVDMKPFWAKYEHIKPYLIPGKLLPTAGEQIQSPDERTRIDVLIDCILCACCHSSCPITASHEKYLGPMALLNMDRFVVRYAGRRKAGAFGDCKRRVRRMALPHGLQLPGGMSQRLKSVWLHRPFEDGNC